MSDDGDKTCPLCAEEMDLTDQQLKPCRCGYEICVWCWHQIMDMAEKENTKGRCPACRTSYNKERIVGMAANCEWLMTESNTEKRYKTQKTKLKMSADARKNLSRVRVVQRNLVYIMGLPSHLADESVLERKEYFGKYGKILKLSISRPTTTTQQASNNCFSVYITYAREEDAIRCIQSVHNYSLEGKSLRASFGTTKYCYSWLRSMICSNPDCLYLHDIGCQEDSFTKDEIISAYSRSRVPQVALNNLQRRAGNVLPAPEDDIGTNGTASSKTCSRMSSNNTTSLTKSTNVSGGSSIVLPATASWGSRLSNKCPPPTTTPCLQNHVKQKPGIFNSSTPFHSPVSSIKCVSTWDDHVSALSKSPDNMAVIGGSRTSESFNHVSFTHDHPVPSDDSSETSVTTESSLMISAWDDDATTKAPEGGNIMLMDSPSSLQEFLKVNVMRGEMTSGLCKSTEIVLDDACNYAWDDDVDATLNQITDPNFYHLDGKMTSLEELVCCSDRDSQTSLSEDTTVGDTSCTSGISCRSQILDTSTEDRDGLVAHEIDSVDSVNVKSIECNDSLSKRFDCDDAMSNSIAPEQHEESAFLGMSAVNFDSQLVVDHQNKDKYQTVSSNNCSKLGDGSSAVKLCQNYLNMEAERQSSVPSCASVVTDSQSFLKDLSGWVTNRQTDVPLAMKKGDNYRFVNDDQRGKVTNVSVQTTFSSCSLNPLKTSCSSASNSCKEDAFDVQNPIVANSLAMDAVMDQRFFTLRNHSAVRSVVFKKDQHDDYAMQREVFETPDMRRTENKCSYLVKSADLANTKTESIGAGEGSIISNMLSLDFDPWDDSLQSADNFTKLLSGMDKKIGSSTLSSSWKLQKNNQSRFSFARQENLANVSTNYSLAASRVEKSSSSIQESFRDGFHNNILLNTSAGPSVLKNDSLFSSNNSAGTLRPNKSAPPGFSVPNRSPPPGFSSQERYEPGYRPALSDNVFHGNPLPRQFELHSPRNSVDVEFIDPAILAVGKGIKPVEVNNSSLGLNSMIPSQFCTTEGNRLQPLMQHSIAAHQDQRIFTNNIPDRLSTMHNAHLSSRFPAHINNTSYSPSTHHQLRTSNFLNSQWNENVKNERFGNDNFIPMNEEHKFRLSSSNYLYNRPYGM